MGRAVHLPRITGVAERPGTLLRRKMCTEELKRFIVNYNFPLEQADLLKPPQILRELCEEPNLLEASPNCLLPRKIYGARWVFSFSLCVLTLCPSE